MSYFLTLKMNLSSRKPVFSTSNASSKKSELSGIHLSSYGFRAAGLIRRSIAADSAAPGMTAVVYKVVITLLVCFFSLSPAHAQDTFMGNSDKPIDITADTLEVQREKEIAIFTGNVEAIQGDMHLRSQKMTVYYGAGKSGTEAPAATGMGSSIERIDVEGRVFLSTPKETAEGDKGVYLVTKKHLTLDGNVVLTQGENVLKGSKLYYDLAKGKTDLIGGAPPAAADAEDRSPASPGRVKARFVPGEKNAEPSN